MQQKKHFMITQISQLVLFLKANLAENQYLTFV